VLVITSVMVVYFGGCVMYEVGVRAVREVVFTTEVSVIDDLPEHMRPVLHGNTVVIVTCPVIVACEVGMAELVLLAKGADEVELRLAVDETEAKLIVLAYGIELVRRELLLTGVLEPEPDAVGIADVELRRGVKVDMLLGVTVLLCATGADGVDSTVLELIIGGTTVDMRVIVLFDAVGADDGTVVTTVVEPFGQLEQGAVIVVEVIETPADVELV